MIRLFRARPQVSVLMAVHNGLPYLREAVQSILAQTFRRFEFVIVDDASTDKSLDTLREIHDPRIRIVQNESNLGLTQSLNVGLDACCGDYVARMDADDICLPERLMLQKRYLDTHPGVGVIGGQVEYIDDMGQSKGTSSMPVNSAVIAWRLHFHNVLYHPTVMFRRELVCGLGGYDNMFSVAQDFELWSRISGETTIGQLDERVLKYRQHAGNITQGSSFEQTHYADMCIQRNLAQLAGEPVESARKRELCQLMGAYGIKEPAVSPEAIEQLQDMMERWMQRRQLNAEDAGSVRNDLTHRFVQYAMQLPGRAASQHLLKVAFARDANLTTQSILDTVRNSRAQVRDTKRSSKEATMGGNVVGEKCGQGPSNHS